MTSLRAAVPSNVYAVDLLKLSTLVRCSEEELVRGMRSSLAVSTEGVIVPNDTKVPFQAIEPRIERQPGVKQVLLTAASRPSPLDMFGVPKCLIELGGQTIIEHILSQLYAAGMERVVISVAFCGEEIVKAVKAHPMYLKMKIEFVDLGSENREGHARSILATRDYFTAPFLLHTSDHIFDYQLLSDIAEFSLNGASACVLVERDIECMEKIKMPSTTVKIQVDEMSTFVNHIGRQLRQYNGIDAGLFLCDPSVYDALQAIAEEKTYFSLAEALDTLTSASALKYMETKAKTWFSIETQEQLNFAKDHRGDPVLSPWTVYLATPPPQRLYASSAPASMAPIHSIVLGVPTEQESTLHVLASDRIQQSKVFSGFVVGVGHVESAVDFSSGSWSEEAEQRPLLRKPTGPITTMDSLEDPLMVSIPVTDEAKYGTPSALDDAHEAFLIEMPQDTAERNVFLAVTENPSSEVPTTTLQDRLTLPSDVASVKLETVGPDFNVHVVVSRQVPAVGFVLLATSLLTISSVGAAMDLQHVDSVLKTFWRISATCAALIPFAGYSVHLKGVPGLTKADVIKLVCCGIAYSLFVVTFILALDFTTLGDAYIFNNSHSLIIVFGKMCLGKSVLPLEGIGAVVGLVGGIVCTFDQTGTAGGSKPVTGDLIAFVGAACGVGYLTLAKHLRPIFSRTNVFGQRIAIGRKFQC